MSAMMAKNAWDKYPQWGPFCPEGYMDDVVLEGAVKTDVV